MIGLSETVEIKIEISRARTEAIKRLLDGIKKAIEEYERKLNEIHRRDSTSHQ